MSPLPRFVTSDNFGAPGIYIREVTPSRPVRGNINTAVGIAGQCVRGPVGRAIEITGFARFAEVFGERDYGAGGAIIGEVWKFLLNKPFGKLIVVRAAAAAAVVASFTAETAAGGGGTAVLRIDASSVGLWGNSVRWKVSAATDGDANKFNLEIRYLARRKLYENLNISSTNDNTAAVVGDDDGRLITLTKLAAGRPVNNANGVDGADSEGFTLLGQTVAAFTSVAGTDGSIADSDFTGTGGPIEILNGYKGVGTAAVAGRSNSAIKTKINTVAAAANDRLWLIVPDSSSVTVSAARTDVANFRNGRVVYCFNHTVTLDPQTAQKITVEPHSWMASDLSQTDPDVHPGDADNRALKAGIISLTYEALTDLDYDDLDRDGISALERDDEGLFTWVSGLTTSLESNRRQLDGRRTKDYLISGITSRLRGSKYKPNTRARRRSDAAAVSGWLGGLARIERFVAIDEDSGAPQYTVANDDSVNNANDQAAGIQKMLTRIRTIPMNLIVELLFEGGTDVTVTELQ